MKAIPLTRGKVTWVDDQDFEWLTKFKWHFQKPNKNGTGYAARWQHESKGVRRLVMMHRQILGLREGEKGDHKNGDGLLNIRENLRQATSSENGMNKKMLSNNTTGFKGVHRHRDKFFARIYLNRKHIHLGTFDTAEDAHRAW